MPLNPITSQRINEMITADATYLRSVLEWCKRRHDIYAASLNETMLTSAGFDATTIAFIEAFETDLANIIALSNGSPPATQDPMSGHIVWLLGLD